ncbi:MAG: hypothetical protein DMF60_11325 [Acidobacteria bacterium]|nr:MAG: hypothetical protein DMF60_11325 [Acidobacteriota bacterium]
MLKTIVDTTIAKAAAVVIDASRNFLWSTVLEHLLLDWGRTRSLIYTLRLRSSAKIHMKKEKANERTGHLISTSI